MSSKVYETANGPHRVYGPLPAQTDGLVDGTLFKPFGRAEFTSDYEVMFELAQPIDAPERIPYGGVRRLDLAPRTEPGEPEITVMVCHTYRDGWHS